jgi:hypothetical protein
VDTRTPAASRDKSFELEKARIAEIVRTRGQDALTPDEMAFAMLTEAPRYTPVRALDFASGEVAVPRWAVQDIWPLGGSGVIGGRPKGGKSTLAQELAISLWSGTPMFGLDRFPSHECAPVLYIQQENSNSRVQRDLQAIMDRRGLGRLDYVTYWEEDIAGDPETARQVSYNVFTPAPHAEQLPAFDVLSHAGIALTDRDDWAWLRDVIASRGYRYVVLDPLYMLMRGAKITDGGDELVPVLTALTALGDELDVGIILTHHMSEKDGAPLAASSLLGSTFIHGWYSAALMVAQAAANTFRVVVDCERDFGETAELTLAGLGVGSWFYGGDAAQGHVTDDGRRAPQSDAKATRLARLAELRREHGTEWSFEQYADALDVGVRAVQRYVRELDELPAVEELSS